MTGRHRYEAGRSSRCPWPGCSKRTRPGYLMCRVDWYRLPVALRSRIWDTYRPGQTLATASAEYLEALRDVLAYAYGTDAAERGEPAPVPLVSSPVLCPAACGHLLTVHSAGLGCWQCDCIYGRGGPGGQP